MKIRNFFENIIPITLFNKGKASQLFQRAQNGETLIIVKNNKPIAVVLSADEYNILRAFPEACVKSTDKEYTIDEEKLLYLTKVFHEMNNGDVK